MTENNRDRKDLKISFLDGKENFLSLLKEVSESLKNEKLKPVYLGIVEKELNFFRWNKIKVFRSLNFLEDLADFCEEITERYVEDDVIISIAELIEVMSFPIEIRRLGPNLREFITENEIVLLVVKNPKSREDDDKRNVILSLALEPIIHSDKHIKIMCFNLITHDISIIYIDMEKVIKIGLFGKYWYNIECKENISQYFKGKNFYVYDPYLENE